MPERLYQLVDRSTDGLVTADQVMEFIAGLQSIRQVVYNNKKKHQGGSLRIDIGGGGETE